MAPGPGSIPARCLHRGIWLWFPTGIDSAASHSLAIQTLPACILHPAISSPGTGPGMLHSSTATPAPSATADRGKQKSTPIETPALPQHRHGDRFDPPNRFAHYSTQPVESLMFPHRDTARPPVAFQQGAPRCNCQGKRFVT